MKKENFDVRRLDNDALNRLVGNNLKQMRLASSYTQEDIANFLQVTHNRISRYESGKTDLPAVFILRLSQYLNVNPLTFFDG